MARRQEVGVRGGRRGEERGGKEKKRENLISGLVLYTVLCSVGKN